MKDTLIKSAGELVAPDKDAAREFSAVHEKLSAQGSARLAQREDLDRLVGKGNRDMAEDNNRNFPKFMESLFSNYSPEVFVDTVLWVFRAYRSHGFHTTYWATNLNLWIDMLKTELTPGAFDQIAPFYNWLIINIPQFTALTDPGSTPSDGEDIPPAGH